MCCFLISSGSSVCCPATMSNKYNLKWNSHHTEAFGNFDLLRNRELLVDVTLSCGGQTSKAHKLVLCTGSAFFERLLQRETGSSSIVHFHGIDMMHLRLLVDFMYLGEVDVPSNELEEFIALADSLEVKGLKGDRSKKYDSGGSVGSVPASGRPETSPSYGKLPGLTSFPGVRPLGAGASVKPCPSASSHTAPVKRRLPVGVDSGVGSVQGTKPSLSVAPGPEKRPRSELVTPDVTNQALNSDDSQPPACVKSEEDDIEEIEAVREDDQSYWTAEEGMSTTEGDNSQSSYQMEGEEFDPSEVPPNIPPEIAPEVSM
ncbi:unnamed protein product, partial [Darwinula stevensoni]